MLGGSHWLESVSGLGRYPVEGGLVADLLEGTVPRP